MPATRERREEDIYSSGISVSLLAFEMEESLHTMVSWGVGTLGQVMAIVGVTGPQLSIQETVSLVDRDNVDLSDSGSRRREA
jgi:hypothetical protein